MAALQQPSMALQQHLGVRISGTQALLVAKRWNCWLVRQLHSQPDCTGSAPSTQGRGCMQHPTLQHPASSTAQQCLAQQLQAPLCPWQQHSLGAMAPQASHPQPQQGGKLSMQLLHGSTACPTSRTPCMQLRSSSAKHLPLRLLPVPLAAQGATAAQDQQVWHRACKAAG